MKLGFVGCGKMGQAILLGIFHSRILNPSDIFVVTKSDETSQQLKKNLNITPSSLEEMSKICSAVILAVKPKDAQTVLQHLSLSKNQLLISIVAGLSSQKIQEFNTEFSQIIRVMPNTPCLISKGVCAYSISTNIEPSFLTFFQKIFSPLGLLSEIPEHLIDAATALSGAGPAYIALITEALCDAGVMCGIPRNQALKLVAQTILGTASLILETDQQPCMIKDAVCSPGGASIAGIAELERYKFRAALIDAVLSAKKRSEELLS